VLICQCKGRKQKTPIHICNNVSLRDLLGRTLTINTEQKILTDARQCFFTHGYKASNMTLISEYAGYSRATIHKYFKNKDDVFRHVVHQFQQQANDACRPILAQNLECWQSINLIMQTWLKPTFDEVNDQYILNDLKYYVQHVAEDIFKQARQDIEDMFCTLFEKAEQEGKLSLSHLPVNTRKLSKLLLASLDGLRGHLESQDLEQASHEILRIFQLACRSDTNKCSRRSFN
jgi:AcrR family transcriptional regulator